MRKTIIPCMAIMAAIFASVCCSSPSKDLPRGNAPEKLNEAIDSFILRSEADSNWTLHSVMVLQHGKVLAEQWFNGESAEKPHVMWSVSKTFTSTAVGFAISEGKLKLDDKVVSFFPEDLPDTVSENLAAATVRDLLTMNIGQDKEPSIRRSDDGTPWTKTFLAAPVEHKPGTWYIYNSYCTYMLSAIVQKVTGEKVNDYLTPRLWEPLGIVKPEWEESPQGINCGGWGLHLKTEDMARMGQTLLKGGKYAGKQVIPADWVAQMTAFQVPCQPAGSRPDQVEYLKENGLSTDWLQGYGYQMWRCTHNAVRADGAYGQYIIIIPDHDAVVVVTERAADLQKVLDGVWDLILPALQ